MNQHDEFAISPEEEALEGELRHALRPIDPPAGFAERTLARVAQPQRSSRPVVILPAARRWIVGAIAAMLLAGAFGAEAIRVQRQQERARTQFELAIQITDRTLAHTREQLGRAGIGLGQ